MQPTTHCRSTAQLIPAIIWPLAVLPRGALKCPAGVSTIRLHRTAMPPVVPAIAASKFTSPKRNAKTDSNAKKHRSPALHPARSLAASAPNQAAGRCSITTLGRAVLKTYLTISAALIADAIVTLSTAPAVAASIDINIGVLPVVVQPQPVYLQPRPAYIQPQYEGGGRGPGRGGAGAPGPGRRQGEDVEK